MVFYIVFQDKVTSQLLPSRGKSAVTALWNPNTKHADSSPSWLSPRNSAPTFLVLFMSAVTVSNWISCAVFAPGVVARVIWAVSHRVDTGTTWWTPLTAFILGTLTWVACHVANEEHALLNYHVGPVPSIEAFTKDFLLFAAPLLKLRHCRVFFPVTTSQVYGRTGDKEEAQSCIPLFSSCLPLKSSSEDKTPFLTAPLQKHKGKQNKTEKVLLLFFVWIWVSVREGGDPASGPPVLPLCLPTRHWFSIDNFHHLMTFITW